MKEKEKAKELVDKFYYYNQQSKLGKKAAKECAKIAVNELIVEHTFTNPIGWNIKRKSFWESVLKEIDNI